MQTRTPEVPPVESAERLVSIWYATKYRTTYGPPCGDGDIRAMSFADLCAFARGLSYEQRAELVTLLVEVEVEPHADTDRVNSAAVDAVDAASCIG